MEYFSPKKTLQCLALLGLFLSLRLIRVFATDTPEFFGSTCTNGDWTNCTYTYADDTSYATYTSTRPVGDGFMLVSEFSGISLPANATVTGMRVEIVGFTNNSTSGRQLWVALSKDGGSSWQTNGVTNDLMWLNPPNGSPTLHTYETGTGIGNFDSYNWSYNDFGSDFVVKIGAYDNTETTFAVDYIKVLVSYTTPQTFLSVMNREASASGQYVSLDLEGQTSTKSATMQCTISGYERCSGQFPVLQSSTPIFHILLDGSNTATATADLGGGWYRGYGWGASSYAWSAEGVKVPYYPNTTCDYPWDLLCSDGAAITQISNFSDHPNQIATPSGQTSTESYTEPEPSNPIAWVVWKVRQTLRDFFIPNSSTLSQNRALLNAELSTRIPFAYASSVLGLNFGTSTAATTAGSIHIALSANASGVIPDIDWTPPDFFNSAVASIRVAGSAILWLMFIGYIVVRTRMFFGA